MKHMTIFPKLAVLIFGLILSFLTVTAQAVEPIIFQVPKHLAAHTRFDTVALNDWRQMVEEGRTSEDELALSLYQLILSMEFSNLNGEATFQGSLNAQESRIILKTLRLALEHVDNSFPGSFSLYGEKDKVERRQYSLLSTLECVSIEGETSRLGGGDLSRCGERFSKFQPLTRGQAKRQASESVLVFRRLAKFLASFERGENILPFLEAYTRTADGSYCSAFIKKYLTSSQFISSADVTQHIGILGRF